MGVFHVFKIAQMIPTAQSVSFLTTTITYCILVGRFLRLPNYLCSHYCYLNWIPLAFGMGMSTINLSATFQNQKSLGNFYLTPDIPHKHTDTTDKMTADYPEHCQIYIYIYIYIFSISKNLHYTNKQIQINLLKV